MITYVGKHNGRNVHKKGTNEVVERFEWKGSKEEFEENT